MPLLDFYVQPRASKTEVVGWHDAAIKIRIKAPPVDGAANSELIGFLAKTLRVPKSSIQLIRGDSSRRKTVEIIGIEMDSIYRALGLNPKP